MREVLVLRPTTLAAALALLLAPAPAAADIVLLAEGGGPDERWAVFRLSVDESVLSIKGLLELEARGTAPVYQIGFAVWEETSGVRRDYVARTFVGGGSEASVTLGAADDVSVHARPVAPGASFDVNVDALFGFSNRPGGPTDKVYHMLVWSAGASETWEFRLFTNGDMDLLDERRGASTFAYGADGFEALAGVVAATGSTRVRATADGHVRLDASRLVLADFVASAERGDDEISVVTPAGERTCPCELRDRPGDGPGLYDFRHAGIAASTNPRSPAQVALVGVLDPEFP